MIVLDENILADQRVLLRRWRSTVQQIGKDCGRKGMLDKEILVLLRGIRRSTFFTRDQGLFQRRRCDPRYCIVHVNVRAEAVAEFVLRFMRHRAFDTNAKRKGCVVRVSSSGISVWRQHAQRVAHVGWTV